jgi:hypothetical protein
MQTTILTDENIEKIKTLIGTGEKANIELGEILAAMQGLDKVAAVKLCAAAMLNYDESFWSSMIDNENDCVIRSLEFSDGSSVRIFDGNHAYNILVSIDIYDQNGNRVIKDCEIHDYLDYNNTPAMTTFNETSKPIIQQKLVDAIDDNSWIWNSK